MQQAISGARAYHFNLYQNKNYTIYNSFATKMHIYIKSPGFEEKQKLIDLIEGFEDLIKKH